MVLAGVAAYNIYEKCFASDPAFYLRDKNRIIIDFPGLGNSGKDCLETEKSTVRED